MSPPCKPGATFEGSTVGAVAWPAEYAEPGPSADEREMKHRVSSWPDYIDSKSWNKLQYPTRLQIAEDEWPRKGREVSNTVADDTGENGAGEGDAAACPRLGEHHDATTDPIANAFRASAERPTNLEFWAVSNISASGRQVGFVGVG